jgi:hypothetical protein
MINFTQAFDRAWERMHIILFRPFDFGKWCTIGFSAFLAGFLEGGNGFNGSYNQSFNKDSSSSPSSFNYQAPDFHHLTNNFGQMMAGMTFGLIVMAVLGITALVFAFIVLLYWLGARGQFMFLDNLVRNRGAIGWPWQFYARQANSLFFFYLLLIALSFAVLLPFLGIGLVMGLPLYEQHRWPHGAEIGGFVILGLAYFAVVLVLAIVVFVFREFGIPLMFRRGLLARPAFWAVLHLIQQHTGTIALFVLLRFAISIAVAVVSIILCCSTCCLEVIPYVGTVILLPALVYVRCFTLDCLAQFGPEYDVWTVDVPPFATGAEATPPPFSPPPPRG